MFMSYLVIVIIVSIFRRWSGPFSYQNVLFCFLFPIAIRTLIITIITRMHREGGVPLDAPERNARTVTVSGVLSARKRHDPVLPTVTLRFVQVFVEARPSTEQEVTRVQ